MNHIKVIMTDDGGIIRNKKNLEQGLHRIIAIENMLENSDLGDIPAIECLNMAQIAKEVLKAALRRTESVGAHFRED